MSAPRSPVVAEALLAQLAAMLGTSVEAFMRPRRQAQPGEAIAQAALLDLLSDPNGYRIAAAFLDVADPAGRRALADVVVSIAGAMNLKRAAG